MAILNDQLGKMEFVADDHITIADIAAAAPMRLHATQCLAFDKHHELKCWLGDIGAVPAWQTTSRPVDQAMLPDKSPFVITVKAESWVRSIIKSTVDLNRYMELYFYKDPKVADIHEPVSDAYEIAMMDG